MHQFSRVKRILTHPISFLRVFLLCLLLLGSQLAVLASFISSAEAAATPMRHNAVLHGVNTKANGVAKPLATQSVSHSTGSQGSASSNAKGGKFKQNVTRAPQGNKSKALGLGPDLGVSLGVNPPNPVVGGTITYTLNIANAPTADPVLAGPIAATDVVALGVSNVTATATSGWTISVSSTTSPSLITANYNGPYPVAAGAALPTITITGTANGSVLGLLANTGTVVAAGDLNLANNSASVDVNIVQPATATAVATSTATAVTTATSTATAVTTATATATSIVPTLTSIVPTVTSVVPTVTSIVPTVTSIVPTVTSVVPTVTSIVPTVTSVVPTVTSIVPTVTSVVPTVTSIVPTVTSVVPTVTSIVPTILPTATATAGTGIDMTINKTVVGGPSFQVGQNVTYNVQVNNLATSVPVTSGTNISVDDVVPTGLDNINATGTGWTISVSSTTGPSLIIATYTGAYPIATGASLPVITITGTFDANAVPSFSNTADLIVPGNIDANTSSTVNVIVTPSTTPTATAIATATGTATSTATATTTATATSTVTATATAITTATATATTTPVTTATATTTPVTTATATTTPTATVTATATSVTTPTVTTTATTTATPTATPDLYTTINNAGGNVFSVGQTITYNINVSNLADGAPESQQVTATDVFPIGLTNIVATGSNWTITLSDTTSPAVLTAVYNGPYPIAPGAVLPLLTVSGTFTSDAVPSFTNTASTTSADDPNVAVDTVTVLPAATTPTATTTATPIATATQTAIATTTATTVPGTVTATATTVPSTPVTTVTPNPTSPSDLSIVKVNLGGSHFKVGDKVTYVLVVSNATYAQSAFNPISVTDVIPVGLKDISVKAEDWSVSTSYGTSPAVVTADYTGIFPVPAGAVLPPITVTGVLTDAAVPAFTDTATVDTLYDIDTDNNIAVDTIFVVKANNGGGNGCHKNCGNGGGNGCHKNCGNGGGNGCHKNCGNGGGNGCHKNCGNGGGKGGNGGGQGGNGGKGGQGGNGGNGGNGGQGGNGGNGGNGANGGSGTTGIYSTGSSTTSGYPALPLTGGNPA